MRALRLIGLALMALGLFLAEPQAPTVYAQPSLDAEAGKKVWDAKLCKSCHGPNAEGKTAKSLAGYPKTAADVIKQVRTPFKMMPSFNPTQVSDQELTEITDYLKSLTPNDFQPAVYQPQPGEDPGKTLFNQKRCSSCHGANAERVVSLVKSTGRTTIGTDDVIKQLRTPRKNMPSFRADQVSDTEAATIASFIKTQFNVPAAAGTAAPTGQAAAAAQSTPAALPKTGGEDGGLPWSLALGLVGLGMIGASFLLRRPSTR